MILRLLIRSNLWVGLAVAAFCVLSFSDPFAKESITYSLFLLFGTASAYSYMRWVKLFQGEDLGSLPKVPWSNNLFLAFFSSLVLGIISLCFLWEISSWPLLINLAPGLLISFLYPLAFPYPNRHFSSLRAIPMLKLFLIAFAWSWLSFGVPYRMGESLTGTYFWVELVMRTLLVAGLTIPFDVRDLSIDAPKLKTLPQQIGIESALALASLLLLLYQIWVLVAYFILWSIPMEHTLAWIFGLEIGQWIIKGVKKNQSDFYVSFWVESIPIITLFIFLLSKLAISNF